MDQWRHSRATDLKERDSRLAVRQQSTSVGIVAYSGSKDTLFSDPPSKLLIAKQTSDVKHQVAANIYSSL
eukprot:scaffold13341_cov134-Cylindrotheca_fusiformis.AAC.2